MFVGSVLKYCRLSECELSVSCSLDNSEDSCCVYWIHFQIVAPVTPSLLGTGNRCVGFWMMSRYPVLLIQESCQVWFLWVLQTHDVCWLECFLCRLSRKSLCEICPKYSSKEFTAVKSQGRGPGHRMGKCGFSHEFVFHCNPLAIPICGEINPGEVGVKASDWKYKKLGKLWGVGRRGPSTRQTWVSVRDELACTHSPTRDNDLHTALPNSMFSDILLVVWNWPRWEEYLQLRKWQMLQVRLFYLNCNFQNKLWFALVRINSTDNRPGPAPGHPLLCDLRWVARGRDWRPPLKGSQLWLPTRLRREFTGPGAPPVTASVNVSPPHHRPT